MAYYKCIYFYLTTIKLIKLIPNAYILLVFVNIIKYRKSYYIILQNTRQNTHNLRNFQRLCNSSFTCYKFIILFIMLYQWNRMHNYIIYN